MFLSEDVQSARAFGEFIHKHAKWELSTGDTITLTRHFSWYNSVVKKIEEHIFELQKVIQPPKEEAKPEAAKSETKKR